jgi:hypothetical protein
MHEARSAAVVLVAGGHAGAIGIKPGRIYPPRAARPAVTVRTDHGVAPENDGAASGSSVATRSDLENGRAAATTAGSETSVDVVFLDLLRWWLLGGQLFVGDIGAVFRK